FGDTCGIRTYATSFPDYSVFVHPSMYFSTTSSGSGSGIFINVVEPNPFRADRPVTASVDGQRFDLQFDVSGGYPQWRVNFRSTTGNGVSSEVMKAIRAGQSITVSGTSAATGQPASITFSAAGFTRAFNEMAQRCNRPGILSWI